LSFLAILITYLKDTKGNKREFNSKGGPQQRVSQLINERSIKHASRRPRTHHVGLIPAQHDANIIYTLFKLMSLDKEKTIQINQPTRCNSFTSLLFDVYVWLNMFRAPLRPSSGA
jgi:hypothetical protein